VRIVPTYAVVADVLSPIKTLIDFLHIGSLVSWFTGNEFNINVRWSLLNSFPGLILPLIASATATFMFRQTYKSIPHELVEAAKMDGVPPMRFFWDILLPLTKANIAAVTVIMFIFGWNQYLWPLLIVTDPAYDTAVVGITKIMPSMDAIPEWNLVMTSALLAMLPPMIVVLILQNWLVRGLIDSEK
jgi:sn-glycerol 3-phosphate transport system permease protein